MTPEERLQKRAEQIALIAMGRTTLGKGRSARKVWAANEDPLAAYLLIESIIGIAHEYAEGSRQ